MVDRLLKIGLAARLGEPVAVRQAGQAGLDTAPGACAARLQDPEARHARQATAPAVVRVRAQVGLAAVARVAVAVPKPHRARGASAGRPLAPTRGAAGAEQEPERDDPADQSSRRKRTPSSSMVKPQPTESPPT